MQLLDPLAPVGHAPTLPTQIHLPGGLVGLVDLKDFELIADEESLPFLRLRSLDEPPIEFVVIEPHGIFPDYAIEISDEDAEELGITSAEDNPLVLNILTIKSMQPQWVTANLVAPIVVNRVLGVGKQAVLENYTRYSTTYPLIGSGA
jgi:flagellar assembly factor FliW